MSFCWGHFQKTCKTTSKYVYVCASVPPHVRSRYTRSILDDISNQVPRASNHMHLVQLSLLYIPKGIRLKGHSFYKLQNRDGTRRRPRTKPKALNPLPFTCPGTSITTVPKPHSDQTKEERRWDQHIKHRSQHLVC